MNEQPKEPRPEELEEAKDCPILRQALAFGALGQVDLREVNRTVRLPENVLSQDPSRFGFVKSPDFYGNPFNG